MVLKTVLVVGLYAVTGWAAPSDELVNTQLGSNSKFKIENGQLIPPGTPAYQKLGPSEFQHSSNHYMAYAEHKSSSGSPEWRITDLQRDSASGKLEARITSFLSRRMQTLTVCGADPGQGGAPAEKMICVTSADQICKPIRLFAEKRSAALKEPRYKLAQIDDKLLDKMRAIRSATPSESMADVQKMCLAPQVAAKNQESCSVYREYLSKMMVASTLEYLNPLEYEAGGKRDSDAAKDALAKLNGWGKVDKYLYSPKIEGLGQSGLAKLAERLKTNPSATELKLASEFVHNCQTKDFKEFISEGGKGAPQTPAAPLTTPISR